MLKIHFTFLIFIILLSCKEEKTEVTENTLIQDSLSTASGEAQLKVINQKIIENPNNADLYNERAKIYLSNKQFEDAINDAKRALRIDSTQATYYLTEADVFFAANETRNAKDVLEKIVVKFPDNTDGLLKLGELFYFVKQYENAFSKINQALKLNQNLAKAYYLKGSIYKETGDTAKAISSLETALEQDNRYFGAFLDLGLIYGCRKNTIALEYYNNALAIQPNNIDALYAKAKLLQDLTKVDDAAVIYNMILKINPEHAFSYYNLGAIEFGFKNNSEKALDYFTKAIQTNPKYAEAYFARGACYQELKEKNNALADYKMCLQLKPNYEAAIEGLNSLGK